MAGKLSQVHHIGQLALVMDLYLELEYLHLVLLLQGK